MDTERREENEYRFFADVKNLSDKSDTLYKAASPLAKLVQVHETFEENGMMGMREAENLEIKSGETLRLKPRSFHVNRSEKGIERKSNW